MAFIACLLGIPALASSAQVGNQSPRQADCAAASLAAHYTPIKSIDFSSRHDVLIRSDDGTLTPMDVPHYKSVLIAPGTWQIESDGDFSYLIEGDNEALAIDTGYGAGTSASTCRR